LPPFSWSTLVEQIASPKVAVKIKMEIIEGPKLKLVDRILHVATFGDFVYHIFPLLMFRGNVRFGPGKGDDPNHDPSRRRRVGQVPDADQRLATVDNTRVLQFELAASVMIRLLTKHSDSVVAEDEFVGRILERRRNVLVGWRASFVDSNISSKQEIIRVLAHVLNKVDESSKYNRCRDSRLAGVGHKPMRNAVKCERRCLRHRYVIVVQDVLKQLLKMEHSQAFEIADPLHLSRVTATISDEREFGLPGVVPVEELPIMRSKFLLHPVGKPSIASPFVVKDLLKSNNLVIERNGCQFTEFTRVLTVQDMMSDNPPVIRFEKCVHLSVLRSVGYEHVVGLEIVHVKEPACECLGPSQRPLLSRKLNLFFDEFEEIDFLFGFHLSSPS
jgi:hypothetical protein